MRDHTSESAEAARSDFKSRLAQRMKPAPQLEFKFVVDSRSYRGDFHDRYVYIDLEASGGKETWYMSLTGGIDRLFDVGRQCDITLKPVPQRGR